MSIWFQYTSLTKRGMFPVDSTSTIAEIKQTISVKDDVPIESQRILFCGRGLLDSEIIGDVDDGHGGKFTSHNGVHLLIRIPQTK